MHDTVCQHKLKWRSGFAIQHEKRTLNRSLRIAVRLHLDPFRIFRLPDNQRATLLLRPAQRSRSDREIAAIELHVQLRIREIDPPCRIPDRRQLHLCPSGKPESIRKIPYRKCLVGRGRRLDSEIAAWLRCIFRTGNTQGQQPPPHYAGRHAHYSSCRSYPWCEMRLNLTFRIRRLSISRTWKR